MKQPQKLILTRPDGPLFNGITVECDECRPQDRVILTIADDRKAYCSHTSPDFPHGIYGPTPRTSYNEIQRLANFLISLDLSESEIGENVVDIAIDRLRIAADHQCDPPLSKLPSAVAALHEIQSLIDECGGGRVAVLDQISGIVRRGLLP